MKKIPLTATDDEILGVVREWAAALANSDYEAAFALTDQDPYHQWTPELIKAVIQGYGLPEPRRDGQVFRVTPMDSAKGGAQPRHAVEYFDVPRFIEGTDQMVIGEVWFDLPVNGEWSDLTANFEVRRDKTGILLVLNEIHVF